MAESPCPTNILGDGRGLEELRSLLAQVLEDKASRETETAEVRDEIARRNGLIGHFKLGQCAIGGGPRSAGPATAAD